MSAKRRFSSHGRINPPEKQSFVGGGEGSMQRAGVAVAHRCRTECLSRIEATSVGAECAIGTRTHSVERGMASTRGLRSPPSRTVVIPTHEAMHIIRKGQIRWLAK